MRIEEAKRCKGVLIYTMLRLYALKQFFRSLSFLSQVRITSHSFDFALLVNSESLPVSVFVIKYTVI